MTTKILGNQITSYTIDTVQLSNTATAAFAKTLAPKVLYANVANSLYYTLDDTAVNVGGGYIVVTGAEFQSGATVLIDTTPASAVTYVNSTTLQVQVPTKSAASYNLYVVNPDGGVGIKVSGITYSSEPSWVTTSPLANQNANTAFGVSLSANGATSYSVAAGSTLPAGTTLAANGYFSGTVSIGAETTYSFSVVATDAELQDSSKTFQVTVTVTPPTRLWVWGQGAFGMLGTNNTILRSSPVQVGTDTNWSTLSGDIDFSAALKTNGTLWTWGVNGYGQLGGNNTVYRSSPTQVGTETNWSKLGNGVGFSQTSAIKTNGTLWTWGRNNNGQLGLDNAVDRSSPSQVGAGTDWNLVSNSRYHTAAIKTNGTLWLWGHGTYGQTGQNNIISRSSPTQVGVGTNWSTVMSGDRYWFATKTDGTLWGCGFNQNGVLGNNTTVYRSSPVQIGSDTNWSRVTGAYGSVFAIKTNGTLWAWGYNAGILGLNHSDRRSSPTQVGTDTNWSHVSTGVNFAVIGLKTNGTLWTWGQNGQGQLGLNFITVERSSPVQVGSSTNWTSVAAGTIMMAITTN